MVRPIALVLLAVLAAPPPAPLGAPPPAIVFVSRRPAPDSLPGAIPGLGPHHRALVTGGRLLVRGRDGRVRDLLPPGSMQDVSHPTVSPDARLVAFAGVPGPGDAWRLFVVPVSGGPPQAAISARAPDGAAARFDDLDPCWVDGRRLCFASTRDGMTAQYGDAPVTNLFVLDLESGRVTRLTSERNGAEKPARDPRSGRILFSRWWHNRWRAAERGVTLAAAEALPADSVNLWQAMEIMPDGRDQRLACGAPATRAGGMCYAPAALADGSIAGVTASNLGLSPASGGVGIARFAPRLAAARRLLGPIPDAGAHDAYGSPRGLAAPAACAPSGLPDGRMLLAYDPGGRGDFGIWIANPDGSGPVRLADLPGTLELDPAPVVEWNARGGPERSVPPDDRAASAPGRASACAAGATAPLLPRSLAALRAWPLRFRFLDLDAFAAAPAPGAPGSPSRVAGARIRFYALIDRPRSAGGDSAVLLREAPLGRGGRVDVRGLPARVPMFEQLVDAEGRVLLATHGPAHVAGTNAGDSGGTVRCIGCHVGHSTRLRRR
jgi:hypothetical protein